MGRTVWPVVDPQLPFVEGNASSIVRGGMGDHLAVVVADLAHDFSRYAHDHRAIRNALVGRHERAGGDHAVASDSDPIENTRAICDERRIAHGTAVQKRAVTDGYIAAERRRLTLVRVNDAAVLHVAALAQLDPVGVAAQHAVEPDARSLPKPYAADHASARRDVIVL